MSNTTSQLAIVGATIIDGNGGKPIPNGVILTEGRRVTAVGDHSLPVPAAARKISAPGKYVIPGLMNANVHLLEDIRLENLARYWGRYEELIEEAAQVALKSGLTTVFDTWGPRRFLMNVRDRINAGKAVGSRIYCAGNIIGFDGPFSVDFFAAAADVASAAFAQRINAIWVENSGRHLMWLTPEQLSEEIRTYIERGIDIVKYGANEHGGTSMGAFLSFTAEGQATIVNEAHRAGITAQAHTMSVEGVRSAIEAGCDLITHCNITGPNPMPQSTIELFVKKNVGAVIFPWTEKGMEWLKKNTSPMEQMMWQSTDINARNLIKGDALLMLANDGGIFAPEMFSDPRLRSSWGGAPEDESLVSLPNGHFYWFRAMEEKGCPPMKMLQAATKNIAIAYRKEKDLGTIEAGKFADMVILDRDPLAAAKNYKSIHAVVKDGAVVDIAALPLNPMLTKPMEAPVDEESVFKPFVSAAKFPMCPMCMRH